MSSASDQFEQEAAKGQTTGLTVMASLGGIVSAYLLRKNYLNFKKAHQEIQLSVLKADMDINKGG